MDVFESLKNLSNSDKARLIVELLLHDTDYQNDPDNPLHNIQRFLVDKSPEKNSPSPKKKQKTLDEWLIKRNDTSKKLVDQPSIHQATNSDFDKVLESEKNSGEANTGHLTPENCSNCNEDSIMPSTSRLVEQSSTNNLSPSVSSVSETNNLVSKKCVSRSKRKVSQPSPDLECEKTPKHVKSTCDKQDHLLVNDGEIESAILIESNCISESENIHLKSITGNNLITKKNKYNLRTKTKKSKLLQVDEASNSKLTRNNQTNILINNHKSNNTVSKSKYEAFCKLNQVCKELNINVLDILRDKNVESVLNDPKVLSSDAVVFIGSLKLNTGKTSPVVHLAKSKKKLLEHLVLVQEKLSGQEPT